MRNLYILLVFFLSTTYVNAQNIKANLFGGTYTYLEFNISEPNNYPIRFDAICSKDSLSVDTTNIDNFVKSVFSSCSNVSISDYANYKAYAIIFGKTKRTYNSCLQFFVDFNYKSDNVHKEGSLILRSGEKVTFKYFSVMGIFLRIEEKSIPETLTSNGLPIELMGKNVVIPISIVDYEKNQDFLLHFLK